jgi:hypothetical protein
VTEIKKVRGRVEVFVTFSDFPISHARWIRQPADVREHRTKLNTELDNLGLMWGSTEGHKIIGGKIVFEAEQVVAERRRAGECQFLVRWAGDYPDDSKHTWEPPTNILDRTLIEDFRRRAQAASKKPSAKRAKVQHEPRPEHTLAAVAGDGQATQSQRKADAAFAERMCARAATKELCRRSSHTEKPLQLLKVEIDEWLFVALHARLLTLVDELELEGAHALSRPD